MMWYDSDSGTWRSEDELKIYSDAPFERINQRIIASALGVAPEDPARALEREMVEIRYCIGCGLAVPLPGDDGRCRYCHDLFELAAPEKAVSVLNRIERHPFTLGMWSFLGRFWITLALLLIGFALGLTVPG